MPGSEAEEELAAVGGDHDFAETIRPGPNADAHALGQVLAEIVGEGVDGAGGLYVDDVRVGRDAVPRKAERFVWEVLTLKEDVKVGMPAIVLGPPADLKDSETAFDVLLPKLRAAEPGKGRVEMFEGVGKGKVLGTNRQGEKANANLREFLPEVGGDEATAILLAGKAEALLAGPGPDRVDGRVVVGNHDGGEGTTGGEPGVWGVAEGPARRADVVAAGETFHLLPDGIPLAGPAGMTKGAVERDGRLRGTF